MMGKLLRLGRMVIVAITASMPFVFNTLAADDVIVLTCQTCEDPSPNLFEVSRHKVVEAFNQEYAGKYRIDVQHFGSTGEEDQYWKRLAIGNALPDIFVTGSATLRALAQSNKLMDLAPMLRADPSWTNSFYEGSFDPLTGPNGEVWGIPEQRDVIGIWYNKKLFAAAGIEHFPTTWDEFLDACAKLKASGVIPFAMDGDWVTQLMWSNLIGTQPGGANFLKAGILEGNYADNTSVVWATEFLRDLHTAGYVNTDAFSGNFPSAGNAYLQEGAAMIANGPWFILDLKGETATPSVYENSGYEISPGLTEGDRGAMTTAGGTGWASGSQDEKKQEAVEAFLRFTTTPDIQLQRTIDTNAYWPVKMTLTDEQAALLDPATRGAITLADSANHIYVNSKYATPDVFNLQWRNDWPAYVQGYLTTEEFLQRLGDAALAPAK